MDLLEKKNLLPLVIFFSCFVSISHADDNQYFDSKVDYFAEPKQECSSCKAQEDMNKKVGEVLLKARLSLQPSPNRAGEVDLFLDPSCQFTQLAIKNLATFNQSHLRLVVKVYVNGPVEAFLSIGQSLSQDHPGWAVSNDLTGGNAKNLGVLRVPAYIFTLQGRLYRVYGTPDLEETWSKIDAMVK